MGFPHPEDDDHDDDDESMPDLIPTESALRGAVTETGANPEVGKGADDEEWGTDTEDKMPGLID